MFLNVNTNSSYDCEIFFFFINICTYRYVHMYFSKQIENNGFVGNYTYLHKQETNLTSHGFSCMYAHTWMYITQLH